MNKVLVVYYSSTGNTEKMADAIGKTLEEKGAIAKVVSVSDVASEKVEDYDALALGCSAMGDEELEDAEFRPFFEKVAPVLKDKKVALFGSYGWGDGQWMRSWEEECKNLEINLAFESVIANEDPDDEALAKLAELANALAE